jgi:hypothetical protein
MNRVQSRVYEQTGDDGDRRNMIKRGLVTRRIQHVGNVTSGIGGYTKFNRWLSQTAPQREMNDVQCGSLLAGTRNPSHASLILIYKNGAHAGNREHN